MPEPRDLLCPRCGPAADPEGFCPRCGEALLDPDEPALLALVEAMEQLGEEARLRARTRLGGLALVGLGAGVAVAAALTGISLLWMAATWVVLLACMLLDYQNQPG